MRNLALVLLTVLLMVSCGKDDVAVHTISSISPTSGTFSTIVTIIGSGFSDVPGDNIVTFNGVPAVVNSANTSQLIVVVPEVAGTGTVNVTISGGEVVGPVFTFEFLFTVSTFAGTPGVSGIVDGNATSAQFSQPSGISLDAQGNILVADRYALRKVTPAGVVTTIAGSETIGDADGVGAAAQFNAMKTVSIHSDGTYYTVEDVIHKIRKVTPAGVVTTWLGSAGGGYEDGPAATAKFNNPESIVFDQNGNGYVSDILNHVIRKVTPAGVVSTFAGNNLTDDVVDGVGSSAGFKRPVGLLMDDNENIYVGDFTGNNIRKITPGAVVSTVSGNGNTGYVEGSATTAEFAGVFGLTFGHDGRLVVTDNDNNRIRLVDENGNTTLLAGGDEGFQNGSAATAMFNDPWGIVYDVDRHCYYIGDRFNNVIRKIQVQ